MTQSIHHLIPKSNESFFLNVYTSQVSISKQIQSKETPIFDQGFANIYVKFRERG